MKFIFDPNKYLKKVDKSHLDKTTVDIELEQLKKDPKNLEIVKSVIRANLELENNNYKIAEKVPNKKGHNTISRI